MSLAPAPAESQEGVPVHYYFEVIWRRKLLIVLIVALAVAVGAAIALLSKPVYRTSAKVLIPLTPPTPKLPGVIDVNNPIAALLQGLKPVSVAAQVEQIESEPFLLEATRAAGIADGASAPKVKVDLPQESDILRISVEGTRPEELARLANSMADLHVRRMDRIQTRNLEDAIGFVTQAKDERADELAAAQARLQAFRAQHPLKLMAAEQDGRSRQRMTMEAKLAEARNAVVGTRAQIETLKELLRREPPSVVRVDTRENPQRALIEERLRQLTLKRTELLQDFVPTAPEVELVEEQIAGFRKELESTPETIEVRVPQANARRDLIEQQLRNLEVALVSQQETYEALRSGPAGPGQAGVPRADSVGPLEVELEALTQERDRLQSDYNILCSRLQDLQVRKHARTEVAQVIDPATVPTRPIWPKPAMLILVAASFGLLLSLGTVFLQEHLDDRVNSARDVERVSGLPTLGWTLRARPSEPALLSELPVNSPVAEAFRAIRANVNFAALDAPIRRLQVTSANQGDGKTFTSLNLAQAMAMEGKRVILVDADMRRPQVHRLLGLSEEPGLSQVLTGSKTVEDVLRETEIPNLAVVCSGPIPPNPAELLASPRFEEIAEELERHADVVIYDTPACIAVTDAVIVGSRMDGVLLLARAGQTRKAEIAHVVTLMERARARMIGTLFTPAKGRPSHYYQYSAPVGPAMPAPLRVPPRSLAAPTAVPRGEGEEALSSPAAFDRYFARGAAQLNGGVEDRITFLHRSIHRLQSLLYTAQMVRNEQLERELLLLLDAAQKERSALEGVSIPASNGGRGPASDPFDERSHQEVSHERSAHAAYPAGGYPGGGADAAGRRRGRGPAGRSVDGRIRPSAGRRGRRHGPTA